MVPQRRHYSLGTGERPSNLPPRQRSLSTSNSYEYVDRINVSRAVYCRPTVEPKFDSRSRLPSSRFLWFPIFFPYILCTRYVIIFTFRQIPWNADLNHPPERLCLIFPQCLTFSSQTQLHFVCQRSLGKGWIYSRCWRVLRIAYHLNVLTCRSTGPCSSRSLVRSLVAAPFLY